MRCFERQQSSPRSCHVSARYLGWQAGPAHAGRRKPTDCLARRRERRHSHSVLQSSCHAGRPPPHHEPAPRWPQPPGAGIRLLRSFDRVLGAKKSDPPAPRGQPTSQCRCHTLLPAMLHLTGTPQPPRSSRALVSPRAQYRVSSARLPWHTMTWSTSCDRNNLFWVFAWTGLFARLFLSNSRPVRVPYRQCLTYLTTTGDLDLTGRVLRVVATTPRICLSRSGN